MYKKNLRFHHTVIDNSAFELWEETETFFGENMQTPHIKHPNRRTHKGCSESSMLSVTHSHVQDLYSVKADLIRCSEFVRSFRVTG